MRTVYRLVLLELAWYTGWYTGAGRYGFTTTALYVGNRLLGYGPSRRWPVTRFTGKSGIGAV